ncbi:phytoene/squalene synthase family protein [bacterium]|nr:phytoene/squalene synthase family protein [bacterium]
MSDPLADSYAFCRKFARRTAKNFYYSFLGLPTDRFDAMCVLYSYMRICDDIGDDEQQASDIRLGQLLEWRIESGVALGDPDFKRLSDIRQRHSKKHAERLAASPTHFDIGLRVLPALAEIAQKFAIPNDYILDVIQGVESDLMWDRWRASPQIGGLRCRFESFNQLEAYCYRVAGVVGRCCIHIWGFKDPRALDLAVDCGLAFQLTNILRDLAEDADNGRVYLPADELQRFDYSPQDIIRRTRDERFQKLMDFQVERAASYYDRASELFECLDPVGQPILAAMIRIYGGLLTEIEKRQFDVYSRRVSLPTWRKLLIAANAMLRRRRVPPRPVSRPKPETT